MNRKSSLVALVLLLVPIPYCGANPPGQTLQVRRTGDSIRLAWLAPASHRYRVEAAPAVSGVWTPAAEIVSGAGPGEVTWTDTNAIAVGSFRFYRLLDQGSLPVGGLSEDAAFRASDLVPVELGDLYGRSAQDASDAIQFATSQAPVGSPPVTHGTLRLTGNASNPVQYDPQPADHLVLVPLQGPAVEVYVQELDLAGGIYQWRQVSGGSDLVLRSEPAAGATRAKIKGRYASVTFPGVVFDIDLTGSISGFSEVDSDGTHNLSDMTVMGTVATAGFAQSVNMRNRFEFISVRGISGRLESASTSENWNNNTVVWGGDTYVWNNVKRQRSFRDGKESQLDTYWNATGTITRNGAEFGRYRKTLTAIGTAVVDLRFQVVLADRVVDVEQWTVQVPAGGN